MPETERATIHPTTRISKPLRRLDYCSLFAVEALTRRGTAKFHRSLHIAHLGFKPIPDRAAFFWINLCVASTCARRTRC